MVEEITSFGRSRGKPWMDRCWIRNRKEVKHKLGKDNPIRRPAQVHSLDTPRNPDTRTRSRNLRKQRKQELSKTCQRDSKEVDRNIQGSIGGAMHQSWLEVFAFPQPSASPAWL